MPGESGLLSLVWMLVCVVAIIGLAYWFTKYVVGRRLGGGPVGRADGMEILMRTQLGKDQQLLVVRVGSRYFLLGATASSISLLAEFTEEEAASWRPPEGEAETRPPSFQEALKTTLRRRMKR